MHIHGTSQIHSPHGTNPPHFTQRGQASHGTSPTAGADRVEISPAAEAAVQASESSEARQALIKSIRAQIAAGTYDTPAKFEAAFERMLDELA